MPWQMRFLTPHCYHLYHSVLTLWNSIINNNSAWNCKRFTIQITPVLSHYRKSDCRRTNPQYDVMCHKDTLPICSYSVEKTFFDSPHKLAHLGVKGMQALVSKRFACPHEGRGKMVLRMPHTSGSQIKAQLSCTHSTHGDSRDTVQPCAH